MLRVTVAGFLILHGILNAVIWIPPQHGSQSSDFGTQSSWLFAEIRPAVVTLAVLASVGFALSGVAYAAHPATWAFPAVVAAVASMALIVATFTPWWSFAVVINAATLYGAWQSTTTQAVA